MRKFIILSISLLFLFHFSPHTAEAKENEDPVEKGEEETEQVEPEEQEPETSESEETAVDPSEDDNNDPSSLESDQGDLNSNRDESEQASDEVNIQNNSLNNTSEEDELIDDRVIGLRENLNILGFPSTDEPDNYYGESTEEAVEKFQKYYSLENVSEIEDIIEQLETILATPLQYGGNDPAVVELKENLVDLGFGSFNFNQNYFSTTAATVEEFQAFYGLKENGIADDRTLAKIEELLNTPMQRGDYRKDAITLKENLAKLGFNVSSSSSPEYDSETESTVQAFQEYYRLDVTGVADDATLDKLEELISTPLQEGGRHEDAIQLKEDLERLGFGSFIGNRNYGSKTASAVEDFQSYYGLKENGIADERTLEKLESILNTPLQYGGNDPLVVELKENLVALGFGSFNFNQNYFSTTAATVEEFQAFYGLKENGIADDHTLAKIEELLNTPMQRGDYRKDAITLKENLAKLGFNVSSSSSPEYDSETESTVQAFQEYYRLDVTGVADDATLDKLEELISTPLQEGGRHKDAIQLKEDLERLGFGSFIGNRNYGSKTASAVEDFQSYYGLKENGIADERTLEKLESILNTPLQYGGNDPLVVELKENLVALGFGSFNFNQNYFSTTEATVEEFQAFYGLKENGIADDRTLAKIEELLNTPMQRGDYRKDAITLKENLAKLGF
ncbi:peptidoglycan-binding protein, partial [Virgibacillus kimchii]